jgi:hypothetical protein
VPDDGNRRGTTSKIQSASAKVSRGFPWSPGWAGTSRGNPGRCTASRGGPDLALRLDPRRARAAAGFDYFAIGVPGHAAIDALARHFDALGDEHAGVQRTPVGWVLPGIHDPDGHEVRFYTVPLEFPSDDRGDPIVASATPTSTQ